jgi:hypothetical protein
LTMVSYARSHQDVVLNRILSANGQGFYIDVGAGHPVVDSVTKHFYDQGWAGINVEPDPRLFTELVEHRTRDVNLNVRLSNRPGVAAEVPLMTLAEVCEGHVRSTVDFLSVTTGRHQQEVLDGGDWQRWRPRVVLVESVPSGAAIPSAEGWDQVLLEADYLFAAFDGLNQFYLRAEDKELMPALAVPANATDDFIPYRYSQEMAELRDSLETTRRELAAARALNATMQHDFAEVSGLRERYRDLHARLQDAQRLLAMARVGLADAHALYLQLLDEVVDVRAQCDEIGRRMEGIHPLGMGLARRASKLSGRFPRAVAGVQKLADVRLALKKAHGGVPD